MCAEYNEPLNRKVNISTTVNHANQLLKEIEQNIHLMLDSQLLAGSLIA